MVLSPDHFLYDADGVYQWSRSAQVGAWQATERRVREMLMDPRYTRLVLLVGVPGAGKSTWLRTGEARDAIYVDATFAIKTHRAPFILLAQQAGKPAEAVFLDTPFEECARRNALRSPDRMVPEITMERFRAQLHGEPPTLEEGFAKVTRVTLD